MSETELAKAQTDNHNAFMLEGRQPSPMVSRIESLNRELSRLVAQTTQSPLEAQESAPHE